MTEPKVFSVSLTSNDPSRAVDVFYKYRAYHLPQVGQTIDVVRFLRGKVIRARVTYVDEAGVPPIGASQID